MLSREKRLTHSRDFDLVYRKGRRVASASFNLSFSKNRLHVTRVGVVVGKRFSKKAVLRNYAKRILREATRDVYPEMKSGFDIVIFAHKKDNQKPTLAEIKKELKAAIQKGGIIK